MTDSKSQQIKILAIDDSPLIHELIKRILEPDYDVLVTDDPLAALSMIYRNDIAIVLLDVTMPQISGLEFCRTLRNLPQFQTLPVVIVTSRDSSFDQVQGRLAGATEYLIKPFNAEQLRQIVQRFVPPLKMHLHYKCIARSIATEGFIRTGCRGSTPAWGHCPSPVKVC